MITAQDGDPEAPLPASHAGGAGANRRAVGTA